jgi:transcriptional regulator with XRE-family HTH domain
MSNVTSLRAEDRDRPTSRLAARLGAALREAREARGVSRRAFARSVQSKHRSAAPGATIAHGSLREIELGTANPTLAKVEEVADLYDVDVEIVVRRRKRKAS